MELRNFMVTAVSMALLLLVGSPLSEAYDFLGKPNHRFKVLGDEPKQEEPIKPSVSLDEPIIEETKEAEITVPEVVKEETSEEDTSIIEGDIPETPNVLVDNLPKTEETVLPEPEDAFVPEVKDSYTEIDYNVLSKGKAIDNLPESEVGNYIILYSTISCPYCDQMISELKGKIEDYNLVVVKCSGVVRDLFYDRWITYFPSFIVIKNKVVRYYGYGYRSLEGIKRLL